ncbi:mCG148160 [Mus musculus]|nr:mCG148160 [Mus musculus]
MSPVPKASCEVKTGESTEAEKPASLWALQWTGDPVLDEVQGHGGANLSGNKIWKQVEGSWF